MTKLSIESFPFKILYQDDAIIIIDKPSRLLTIPDGYHPSLPCVSQILQSHFERVWVVHRVDKETSGVMIFALSALAHRDLNIQFETRQVHKTYHAYVTGLPAWNELDIQSPIKTNGDRQHRTIVTVGGKPARSAVIVIERLISSALVSVHPHTGYTHQIRSHLASVGHPILGDVLYHAMPQNTPAAPANRLMLHAYKIEFTHPITQSSLSFTAPYPPDFQPI